MEVARFLKYIIFLILLTIKNIIVLVVHTDNISASTECQNEYISTTVHKARTRTGSHPGVKKIHIVCLVDKEESYFILEILFDLINMWN